MKNLTMDNVAQHRRRRTIVDRLGDAFGYRFHDPCWAIHATLTLILICFGLRLILPQDTFALGGAYSWFGGHWPYTEARWGWMFVVLGSLGLPALIWTEAPWIQFIGASVLALSHALLAQGFYNGSTASTGWLTYSVVALLGAYRLWIVHVKMRPGRPS